MDTELILKTVHGLIDGERAKRELLETQVESILKESVTSLKGLREKTGQLEFLFEALTEYLQIKGIMLPDDWAKFLQERIEESNKAIAQMMANLERLGAMGVGGGGAQAPSADPHPKPPALEVIK